MSNTISCIICGKAFVQTKGYRICPDCQPDIANAANDKPLEKAEVIKDAIETPDIVMVDPIASTPEDPMEVLEKVAEALEQQSEDDPAVTIIDPK